MVFLDQLVLAIVVPVAIVLLAKRQTPVDNPQHNPDNRKKYYDY